VSGSTGSSLSAPGSINDVRTEAHLAIGQRLGSIDLSPLLLYTVSGAPESALPFLAWQFDVLSPWWQLLAGPESQTAIIQNAVALHRYAGTVSAIQQAMANLGFPLITILEGQNSWGGTAYPIDEGWAVFQVIAAKANVTFSSPQPDSWDSVSNVDLLTNIDQLQQATSIAAESVTISQQTQAIQAIDFFKPQRSVLDSLWFEEVPLDESLTVGDYLTVVAANFVQEAPLRLTDFLTVPGWTLADTKTTVPLYNAHFYHTGINYGWPQPAVVDSGVTINGTPTE